MNAFRFFFEFKLTGEKRYLDIYASNFRQARNQFFDFSKDLKYCHIDKVVNITDDNYMIVYSR